MTPILLQALLPLAINYVVPMVEKIFGGKKTPTDTNNGDIKLNAGVGLLQQLSALKGVSGTSDELKAIIQSAVDALQPLGLGDLSKSPSATIAVPTGPITLGIPSSPTGAITFSFAGATVNMNIGK